MEQGQNPEQMSNEMLDGLMQSENAKMQAAEAIAQMNPEAAQMLQQSAQMAMQAIELLGQGAPKQGGQAQAPNAAGTNAKPTDPTMV
jgi:hypothetical protein